MSSGTCTCRRPAATNDMYGGHRLGNNLYTSSIVCLDAKTGKRVWHFQTVHHDLFDYDNPAAPILVDITVTAADQGARAGHQAGLVFVLDRVTGKPVWPIEERPVPASTVPGEKASPTQPIPTKPPPFERQGLQADDLIDFTPQLRAEALEIIKQYVTGRCSRRRRCAATAPATRRARFSCRARTAASHWTGRGVRSGHRACCTCRRRRIRSSADLLKGNPEETNLRYRAGVARAGAGPRGLPLVKPPYGRITAIDLNTGEHVWMVANGDGPRNHPELKALNLPPLGQAVRSTAIVDEDAAVRDRRRSEQPADAARRRRQEVPRARQGDRARRSGRWSSRPAPPARR